MAINGRALNGRAQNGFMLNMGLRSATTERLIGGRSTARNADCRRQLAGRSSCSRRRILKQPKYGSETFLAPDNWHVEIVAVGKATLKREPSGTTIRTAR